MKKSSIWVLSVTLSIAITGLVIAINKHNNTVASESLKQLENSDPEDYKSFEQDNETQIFQEQNPSSEISTEKTQKKSENQETSSCFSNEKPKQENKKAEKQNITSSNSKKEEIQEPTFVNGILIANKTYPLPKSYNYGNDPEALSAFEKMRSDAKKEGLNIYISSGFRSYELQERVYNSYVRDYGQASADTFSARPGHSEHQTGLAFDLNSIDDSFTNTPECEWVKKNCHKYGFIVRYPKGKEQITGYKYEPWHIRYLGVDIATNVYKSGLCLEEYLGITSCYK